MKNDLSILITRPKDDLTTNYLFYWAGLVVEEAKNKGYQGFIDNRNLELYDGYEIKK